VLEGHMDFVVSVSVRPDGLRAVSASYDDSLRVWDLETGRHLRALEGRTDDVNSVSVTPDGLRAVSASSDKTLRVWEVETGGCIRVLEGHLRGVSSVSVTPDGLCAISASDDNTFRVWELETGRCPALACLPAPARSVAISSKLGQVVAGTQAGQVLQFDLRGMSLTAASQAS
jgi:WD40 repeat protein